MEPLSALQVSAGEGTGGGVNGPGYLPITHRPFLTAATCSQLGQELLVAGGNVVDAGVGAALCLAVVHPHATGLGQCDRWARDRDSNLGPSQWPLPQD